jgi:rhodanese-related sulfurtransferase
MASANAPALGTAPDISRQEIFARRGDPTLLVVDVLPRESFLDSHLPGAVNLPVADIPASARGVLGDPADTSREIALYCASPT